MEPTVWTERMLAALEDGVKGGKWFSWMDKVYSDKLTFSSEDGWIRGRLRNLLRQRQGKKGPARGEDHHRWPNAFFREQGLSSLSAAHASVWQSRGG
jgi:hypothetical protein